MIQSNYTVIILQPNEGYTLTQANDEIEIKDRVLSKKVYLAINDSQNNWKEITDEDAELIRIEQNKLEEDNSEE